MAIPGKGEPKYLQIAADLRRSITSGERGPDSRLPGENDLMGAYQVARETARKALAQLINEGLATPRRGSGVYVRGFRRVIRDGIARLSGSTWPEGKSVWGQEADGSGPRNRDRQGITGCEGDLGRHRYADSVPRIQVQRPQSVSDWVGSLPGTALITFIALKLAGVVAWSWWWVLSPLWIGGLALALLGGALAILWSLGHWPVTLVNLFRWRGRLQAPVFIGFDASPVPSAGQDGAETGDTGR